MRVIKILKVKTGNFEPLVKNLEDHWDVVWAMYGVPNAFQEENSVTYFILGREVQNEEEAMKMREEIKGVSTT